MRHAEMGRELSHREPCRPHASDFRRARTALDTSRGAKANARGAQANAHGGR